MHLANKLPAKEFKLTHSFHPSLIKYHHLGNLLIKVLNWFLFGKRAGKAFLPVSESIEAGIRKTDIIFKVRAGGSFSKSLKTWSALPVRLSPRDLVMGGISWVGLFENPWKPDSPHLSGFLPYGLVRGRVSWADFFETPENLTRLAHQVFFPMAFLGVGSRALAPSSG